MPGDTGDQKDMFTILPPNPRIFARTRGSCGPFLGGKPTNVGGERGDFMDGAQAYTKKRRIHNCCTQPVEYSHAWLSASIG